MSKIEPARCPTCGHIIDNRVIFLDKYMVGALIKITKWCEEKGKNEFTRKDIKHLLTVDVMVSKFGDWRHFGGVFYRPEGGRQGDWGLNVQRALDFLEGRIRLYSRLVIDRQTKEIVSREDPVTVNQVPSIGKFLDEYGLYKPEYIPKQ